jgi:hypothetical protein
VTNLQTVLNNTAITPSAITVNSASCPAGKRALGGGYFISGDFQKSLKVIVYASWPDGGTWLVNAFNPNPDPQPISVYVQCANVS